MSTSPSAEVPDPPFPIPVRTSSLLRENRLQAMREAGLRYASTASKASNLSLKSTPSEFLETKIQQLVEYKSFAEIVKAGIIEAREEERVPVGEFSELISPVLGRLSAANKTLQVLKRQKCAISDDIEEVAQRPRLTEPSDPGLLERAYSDTIVSRVMSACAKQTRSSFNKNKFKALVNEYYGIASERPSEEYSWCHAIGDWIPSESAKAAHLVPKSLHESEVAHIFGDVDEVLSNPQNALSLHKNIEGLMDQGIIVIVPGAGDFTSPTQWRCLVLDRTVDSNMVCKVYRGNNDFEIVRVQHLHNKPLTFINENRPRRRYLYFRFVISYLNAKRLNKGNITVPIETRKFWPSSGEYLHKSTLQALARSVSGSSIPEEITETHTFGDTELQHEDLDASNTLAAGILEPEPSYRAHITQCIIESSKLGTLEKDKSDTEQDSLVLSPHSQDSL